MQILTLIVVFLQKLFEPPLIACLEEGTVCQLCIDSRKISYKKRCQAHSVAAGKIIDYPVARHKYRRVSQFEQTVIFHA